MRDLVDRDAVKLMQALRQLQAQDENAIGLVTMTESRIRELIVLRYSIDQRWLEVRLPDKRSAWVQAGDVRADSTPLSIEASLWLAKRFLGITYTWGGSSSFGYDCSGFTQTLIRRRGAIMPRDAGPQARWSGVVPVEQRAELKPGDLLFFGKDVQHISHTGMFIGDGQFIHDTPKDHPGVQISRIDDPVWSAILVAMRRLK